MTEKKVNTTGLPQAIQEFGSLRNVIDALRKEEKSLEAKIPVLRKDVLTLQINIDKKESTKAGQSKALDGLHKAIRKQFDELDMVEDRTTRQKEQYQLFEGFLVMLASSPSVNDSIEALIASLKRLLSPGWQLTRSREEMRSLFIRTILGDYLQCFSCSHCGSRFIINRSRDRRYLLNSYCCPLCNYSSSVKADESFLKALVSQDQLENTYLVEQLLEENATLKPLEAFFSIPCEMCKKPITDWTKDNVNAAIMGFGWGHVQCWNTGFEKIKILLKALKQLQETQLEEPSNEE